MLSNPMWPASPSAAPSVVSLLFLSPGDLLTSPLALFLRLSFVHTVSPLLQHWAYIHHEARSMKIRPALPGAPQLFHAWRLMNETCMPCFPTSCTQNPEECPHLIKHTVCFSFSLFSFHYVLLPSIHDRSVLQYLHKF